MRARMFSIKAALIQTDEEAEKANEEYQRRQRVRDQHYREVFLPLAQQIQAETLCKWSEAKDKATQQLKQERTWNKVVLATNSMSKS